MQNPEDISDPTTAIDMTLALMAKAFTLNNTTPTNNNQRSSSNPSNMQIVQPGMNMDQDRHMTMVEDNVGNHFRPNAVKGSLCQQLHNKAKETGCCLSSATATDCQVEEAGIQRTQKEFKFMAATNAYEETERVKVNCILENNLQHASTSGTQSEKAPIYDSDGSAEVHLAKKCYNNDIFNMFTQEEQYTELLVPILEPHQVPQNDSNVSSKQAEQKQESLYNGKVLLEKHDPPAVYDSEETLELAQENEILPIVNQVDARVHNFEIRFLKEATKFVRDFKSLAKEADESLVKHKALELEIECLLRVVVSQDIRINPFKASRVENFVPNKHVKASVRTKPITAAQPHVITKNDVNSKTNGFSPKDVKSTTRTRRPQPRNNPKNDKQCLIIINHDVYVLNYVNGMNSRSDEMISSNSGLKRIFERIVGEHHAKWADKLDDALWAFHTTSKSPISCTPYKLVYDKACHLPIELEHKSYWALKWISFDLKVAGDHRKV
nr:reverse transcriptase domain-containing protein [Tanacetum cinerariifolium]